MWTRLVTDLFGRTHESWHEHLHGLDAAALAWRPERDANPIGWITWHALRVQDDHLAKLADRSQLWHEGWSERFGLPYEDGDIGYGQDTSEVTGYAVSERATDFHLLLGYADAVHERTVEIVESLAEDDLDRVVDHSFDPPVTLGVRLVSVVNDVTQHVGQVGYVVGLLGSRG